MTIIRFQALKELLHRKPVEVTLPSNKVTDYYGDLVFNTESMRKYLSREAFIAVQEATIKGVRIDRRIADSIAAGMKAWAIEKGVSHYTHWFQPLTDGTAEKHDAFIDFFDDGNLIIGF